IGSYVINNARGPDLTGAGMIATLNPRGGGGFNTLYFSDGTTNVVTSGVGFQPISTGAQGEYHVGLSAYTDVYGDSKNEWLGGGGLDTLGRAMLNRTDSTNQTVFNVYDSAGVQRAYTINYIDLTISTAFNMNSIYGGPVTEYIGTRKAISSVVLP